MSVTDTLKLGAAPTNKDTCEFRVWAPFVDTVEVHIVSPVDQILSLSKDKFGYHSGIFSGVKPGSLYFYRLDGAIERPDPASSLQPNGVHGPSQVVDSYFEWTDNSWLGEIWENYIIYELHVGVYSPEGSFEGVINSLEKLLDLGVTAIELMPVSQFPGVRNWGYDGVYPYAVQNSYGGPAGLKMLVNACHSKGLAVILDVVYNHLGPEGNYLNQYGPYFTDRYKTPWGPAVNFDGPYSDEVRFFFLSNALRWVTEFHIDALRIDAIHGIFDFSAYHFLEELSDVIHQKSEELCRKIYLIAESDLNDSRVIQHCELGGYGLTAQWNDDFHHAVHTILTGESAGHYEDFGSVELLARVFKEGFAYSGQRSLYRKRKHGNSAGLFSPDCFVVFAQNHDQIGNRPHANRLTNLIEFEGLKLFAGLVILSPFVPMLFMGEEYGETAPFHYFINHSDPELLEAIKESRKQEMIRSHGEVPPFDPQDEVTFLAAKLRHDLAEKNRHRLLFEFYKNIISLRKNMKKHVGKNVKDNIVLSSEKFKYLFLNRRTDLGEFFLVFHLNSNPSIFRLPIPEGRWSRIIDSADIVWGGNGTQIESQVVSDGELRFELPPHCFVVFQRT